MSELVLRFYVLQYIKLAAKKSSNNALLTLHSTWYKTASKEWMRYIDAVGSSPAKCDGEFHYLFLSIHDSALF